MQSMSFGYRHSIFSNKNAVIIDTTLRFQTGDKDEIEEKLCQNLDNRREKQPIDKPSAGSTFKRGEDFITAQLIDECGLKGYTVGGAQKVVTLYFSIFSKRRPGTKVIMS